LRTLPIPKYRRIRNIKKPEAVISPRLVFAKIKENVKRSAIKIVKKNRKIAP
jgi:hypothetical protein